jgi:hypothetical protein
MHQVSNTGAKSLSTITQSNDIQTNAKQANTKQLGAKHMGRLGLAFHKPFRLEIHGTFPNSGVSVDTPRVQQKTLCHLQHNTLLLSTVSLPGEEGAEANVKETLCLYPTLAPSAKSRKEPTRALLP